jgi:hypothetical protein
MLGEREILVKEKCLRRVEHGLICPANGEVGEAICTQVLRRRQAAVGLQNKICYVRRRHRLTPSFRTFSRNGVLPERYSSIPMGTTEMTVSFRRDRSAIAAE